MIKRQFIRRTLLLHGIVCAYNHAAAGLNPKCTICAFFNCIIEIVMKKG